MNIKTDREAVERLLAERDAAIAEVARLQEEVTGWSANAWHERGRANKLELEVARLSTPPDDADVAELVDRLLDTADIHEADANDGGEYNRAMMEELAARRKE